MSRPKRTYRKALLHVVVVLAVIAALLVLLSSLFVPKDNSEEAGMLDATANGVLGEPDNTIDVIIIGDSKAYSGISPMVMWSDYGIASYSCTTKSQKLPYAFTLLKRATQKQTPSVVVIEANEIHVETSFTDIAKRALQDALPVLEYHDRWKSLTLRDLDPRVTYTWTDDYKGFYMRGLIEPADTTGYMASTDEVEEIPRASRWCLSSIIDYCREIGATPVIVAVPATLEWSRPRHNAIQAYADEMGVDFIDMNTEPDLIEIDWQIDSRDAGGHLNLYGATKVSDRLGQILSERYGAPDHREDPAYSAWFDSLEVYNATVCWYMLFPDGVLPIEWFRRV